MNDKKITRVVGIDLGTTNSCVVTIIDGSERILCNSADNTITPSYIAFEMDKNNKVITHIGEAAQRQSYSNPQHTLFVIKRLIGLSYDEASKLQLKVPYKIVSDDNGNAAVSVYGKKYSPEYCSGMFLLNLIEQIKQKANCDIVDVVITVPANFNNTQRQATKDAGTIAGLNVLRIINEPTAAAIAYGEQSNVKLAGKIIVYDLGGGTFDVSVLDVEDKVYDVVATGGDMQLGGEDFDDIIHTYVLQTFRDKEGITLDDNVTLHRIKTEAKNAKELLSKTNSAHINIPYVAPGPKHINVTITRAWFEDQIRKQIEKTVTILRNVLKKAMDQEGVSDIKDMNISAGILVGGSTRIPLIKQLLEKEFGIEFLSDLNPDTIVAVGAAYQAAVIKGSKTDIAITDVAPLSIGIETLGGVFTRLIEKDSKIPNKVEKIFTTAADNQTQVDVKLYQGEREIAQHNKYLDTLSLVGIKPAPRGVPKIKVRLKVDTNGIIHAYTTDEASGIEKEIVISSTSDKEEIQRMVQEAQKQKENDRAAKELIENKNECVNIAYELKKQIDKISDSKVKDDFTQRLDVIQKSVENDPKTAKSDLSKLLEEVANYVAKNSKKDSDNVANKQQKEDNTQNDGNQDQTKDSDDTKTK